MGNGKRAGFTLIELLVVIAIVGILSAMLLPALARAKAMAKRAGCTNNTKQLAISMAMYTSDFADWLPANGMVDPPNPRKKLWVQGAFFHAEHNTNNSFLLNPDYALFAGYITTSRVYLCPTDKDHVTINGVRWPRIRSYALNAYVGWTWEWDSRIPYGYRVYRKHSDFAASATSGIFTFQDVHPESICWPFFGVLMGYDYFFNFPNSSHDQGGIVAFADGHVERHKWRDPRTVTAFSTSYHSHYEASAGNQDLQWIRSHTTVPRQTPAP